QPLWRPKPITSDLVLFENPDPWVMRVAYFCAVGQLMLWVSLADWVWRDMKTEVGLTEDGSAKYEAAPSTQRKSMALFCLTIGGLIAGGVHFYATKRIRTVRILKGGKAVVIETSQLVGKKMYTYPTTSLRTFEKVYSPEGYVLPNAPGSRSSLILKPESRRNGYTIDRSGEFPDPQLWDALFYK
ncbi:transmembrane protein 223-domain-containing protein, partial [Blyttiomyces helicus]